MAGKLNWACRVVYGGCTFLCRILDMMNSMSPSAKHRLTASFYRDISWWVNFTHFFMGTQIFLNQSMLWRMHDHSRQGDILEAIGFTLIF